jgi:hypothetical protein
MPGVVVKTAVRTGPSTATVNPSSSFFVVGTATRGPVGSARQVNSLVDFEVFYGEYAASKTLHQHVQTFFEEGGSQVYVSRVAGAGASAGSSNQGSFILTAANPGAWSSSLEVEAVPSGSGSRLRLYLDGEIVYTSPALSTVDELVTAINGSTVASTYVTASLETPEAAFGTFALVSFTAGADGSAPTASELIGGLDLFGSGFGSGAVSIPELHTEAAYDAIITHCVANNRIAILSVAPGATNASDAIDEVGGYIDSVEDGEYAAMYFPHLTIPGPVGTTRTISPESYVAAKRAIAHNNVGAWSVGAGLGSKANFVNGVSATIDKTSGQDLDDAQINAIRIIQNSVRIYGARSMSTDAVNFRFINSRDMLNFIVAEAEKRLEDLVFAPIDGRRAVFGRVESYLIALLDPLRTAGGLYEAFDADGNRIDSGYSVEVSDALNPISQLADGVVRAKVGVRISSISDKIEIEIVKSNLTSSVV